MPGPADSRSRFRPMKQAPVRMTMKSPAQLEGLADLRDVTPDELLSLDDRLVREELLRLIRPCTGTRDRIWNIDG